MIKGILFDFDGTLSLRYEAAYFMYRWCLHQIFPEMDVHDIDFEAIIQRCLYWDQFGTVNKHYPFEMLKKHYKEDLDVEYWVKCWYQVFHEFQVEMPEVYDVLNQLSHTYKLGIVTNGDGPSQLAKVETLDLSKYFTTVIASGNFGVDKPDPRIYKQAAKDLGLKCEEIAFIGDTFATDIVGAKKVGMLPVWYCYEHKGITLADIKIVESYEDIRHMFLEDTSWNV